MSAPPSRREPWTLLILAAACLLPVFWPGDAAFINDEPKLIAAALAANATHTLASEGLMGTYGFIYGPLPIWVYQMLLALTHDLVVVAALHALLIAVTTAGALWWLSRTLDLWKWFAPVPLLSPYFWFYSRVLWDNPFLIPLGALAVAGYAAYLQSGRKAGLRIAVAAAAGMLLVHLMGIALVVPLGVHMLMVRGRGLWKSRWSIVSIAVVALWLAWPYWKYLAVPSAASSIEPAADVRGWFFPLLGGRLFTAHQLEYFFGAAPVRGGIFPLTVAASFLGYVLVWGGIAICIIRLQAAVGSGRWAVRDHVAAILLGALSCQVVIDGISGRYQHPHYQNGTWIAFALLAWLAIDELRRLRGVARLMAPAVNGVLAAALTAAVVTLAVRLHRSHGTRELYGPTLGEQQETAQRIARYAPSSRVTTQIIAYELYPHTLDVLRRLSDRGYYTLPARVLELRYASDDPDSGAMELVER